MFSLRSCYCLLVLFVTDPMMRKSPLMRPATTLKVFPCMSMREPAGYPRGQLRTGFADACRRGNAAGPEAPAADFRYGDYRALPAAGKLG